MKIYVSSHDLLAAAGVAMILRQAGHKVVSTWHDEPHVGSTEDKAQKNCNQIRKCETLVVHGGRYAVTGGKWFEAGFALALGKTVICLGERGNILAWHPDITEVPLCVPSPMPTSLAFCSASHLAHEFSLSAMLPRIPPSVL